MVGALALAAAFSFNPIPDASTQVTDAVLNSPGTLGKWLTCAVSLCLASIGLTFGVVALLALIGRQPSGCG